jgi:cyclopropane fatty-acyl-phospholipid synthase-like methyltransferase
MLAAFAERGVEAIGIDISPSMVALARERLSSPGLPADALVADMTCFDLGRTFGAPFVRSTRWRFWKTELRC